MRPANTASHGRLASLDFLRTAAFLVVALSHFGGMLGPGFPADSAARAWCDELVRYGSLGTNTFFLCSTLLLCRSLNSGRRWRDAVAKRMARLYPGFMAILALYLILTLLFPGTAKIPSEPLPALLHLAANLLLLPGILPITPIVTVAWSLSYVAFSYLATGALYRLTGMRAWTEGQRAWLWLALAAVLVAMDQLAAFPHGRLAYFAMGGVLAECQGLTVRRSEAALWAGGLGGALLLAVAPVGITGLLGLTLFVGAWTALPVLAAALSHLPLEPLARISYPVFLTHGLVFHAVKWAGPETAGTGDLVALLLAGVALILATAMVADAMALRPLRLWFQTTLAARRIPSEELAARAAYP